MGRMTSASGLVKWLYETTIYPADRNIKQEQLWKEVCKSRLSLGPDEFMLLCNILLENLAEYMDFQKSIKQALRVRNL
jgi:hypothetical protein